MQNLDVVVLKSSKINLLQNVENFQNIEYPYVIMKEKKYNDFLACTLRRCFAKDKNIATVIQVINKDFIRR